MIYEVTLARKSSVNEVQNARRRVEYVTANSPAEAKRIAMAMSGNAAFTVSSIREAAR